jgi:amidophosphoribosyltransferase
MSKLGDFAAFQAAISIHKEKNNEQLIHDIYKLAKIELSKPVDEQINVVQRLYEGLTNDEISKKIADIVKPTNLRAEFNILFQTVDNLHLACPNDLGDWYFTGNYPTPGGVAVANRSFLYYYEGKKERAY